MNRHMRDLMEELKEQLPGDEPNKNQRLHTFAEFVNHGNKRKIILYLSVGPYVKATTVARIVYIMPASSGASRLFGPVRQFLEPSGLRVNIFHLHDETAKDFVISDIAKYEHMYDWVSEIHRITDMKNLEPAGIKKNTLNNIILYWKEMRSKIYDVMHFINIRLFRTSSGSFRGLTPPRHPPKAVTPTSNAGSLRSSSSSGTRRSTYTPSNRSRRTRSRTSSPRPNLLTAADSDPKPPSPPKPNHRKSDPE